MVEKPRVEPVERVLAVVLAAGGGSRFTGAGHKLLAARGGRTVVEHAVAAAHAALGEVLVVTGAVRLPDVAAASGIRLIHNPDWADGQATSLATAITLAAADDTIDAVVVGLGDQPDITSDAWRRVASAAAPIAIATYDGRRRNPVRLHRSVWPLLPTTGDEGARALTRLRPDLVEEVPCSGSPDDIDTLEDVLRWQSKSSTNSQ